MKICLATDNLRVFNKLAIAFFPVTLLSFLLHYLLSCYVPKVKTFLTKKILNLHMYHFAWAGQMEKQGYN